MQIIKWVILFVMLSLLVPDTCRAARAESILPVHSTHCEVIGSKTSNMINSLKSMLRVSVSDLTQETTHTTFDKKNFIRLFIYLKYSNLHFSEYSRNTFISCDSFFLYEEQIAYYVYALQRIIV